ncbi:hypothetical protein COT68_01245 [bacterium (Candidatus Torokbacteria) CG09_land_8_20_14_0_10_42_11]|nr:MAG: hypothetical protein COT68_01245 [bacterium (Candidatus Torokbacteria) CG09_land_8_20_14_0_10_42_11]
MPLYTYLARDKQGNSKQGEIDLDSEARLAEWLSAQGFLLTRFEEKGQKKKWPSFREILSRFGFVSLMDKVLFTRYLEVMLKAGLSLVRALNILASQTANRKLQKVISALHSDVEKGVSLNEALGRHPHIFSELYVNVVKTGEASGMLTESLDQLATQLKKDRELIKKVTGALIYPVLVLVAMVGIGFLMLTFVLPKLISVFENFNTRLPLPTRILIAMSKFMGAYYLWVLGVAAILGVFTWRAAHSQAGRLVFHWVYLRLPVVAKIIKKVNLARFIRNLASLLASGMPILKVLDVTADALGNVYYKKAVRDSITEVQKGVSLSKAISQSPLLFPPIVTQVIEVGEETGSLDQVLLRLAEFYEEDVEQTMKNISTIIEPLLMLVIGGAVGIMAVAMIMPIYSITGSI